MWPNTPSGLADEQTRIASLDAPEWTPEPGFLIGAAFVCFERGGTGPGAPGDRGWAAAAVRDGRRVAISTTSGEAGAAYEPGLLALREGRLLDAAVTSLAVRPDVLLVDATGRDHPRRAGLALQLGVVLDLPTVGVTNRPLVASGPEPGCDRLSRSPLAIGREVVGYRLRTRELARSLCVHAGWRTTPETAVDVVVRAIGRFRTPEPLRRARTAARGARAGH
ncbi:MAG: endonuclease V [Acidimicrobiia bacterium]